MTPDTDICARCKLPDCDISHRGCGLRRTYNLVRSNLSRGLPVSDTDKAVADAFARENRIDWRANNTEARR